MLITYLRTAVLYLLLIGVIRMMGKRQIGQMEPSEFVVTMLAANLAAIPMQDGGIPVYTGAVPILTVLGMELVLSGLSLKSIRIRRVLCGKPVILVENGKPIQENLRRTRVTMDELTGHLREKDVLDIQSVQYAILETNGNLSVFPYPHARPASAAEAGVETQAQYLPVTLVTDGHVMEANLRFTGRNRVWLDKELKKHQATLAQTWLLTVDQGGNTVFFRKEGV